MTREEAIEVVIKNYPYVSFSGSQFESALRELVPELEESEDERMTKEAKGIILEHRIHCIQSGIEPSRHNRILAWLEKQKEQPKEELVYRLNGFMQEYIKEGKDEAEKEHRFKCYHLFWDALEDENFFEQKEQKPDDDPLDDPKFIKGFDTGREVQRIFDEQKPAAWSEEDEIKLKLCEDSFRVPQTRLHLIQQGLTPGDMVSWLKSLRPSWKPSEDEERFDWLKSKLNGNPGK